jgi:two-component system, sensor histidine kinase and response regulator
MTEPKARTIVVVEDEPELLGTILALFRDLGYDVIGTGSAEEALVLLPEANPSLVVIDIKLPGIDGFDLLGEIKNNPRLATVPVVFLTAFNNLQAAINAKKAGAVEYITKPFDFEHLISVVTEIVPPL